MSTAAVERTLLANIKANLNDTTNHSEAYALFKGGRVRVLPVFIPLFSVAPPYAVIVPGGSVGDSSGVVEQIDLDVSVYVVSGILEDPFDEAGVLGGASLDDLATLARVVRDALVRPQPYVGSPYDSSPYTELPQVVTCLHARTGVIEAIPDGDLESDAGASLHLARPVTLTYGIWES